MIHFLKEIVYQLNKKIYYPIVWRSFYFKTKNYQTKKDESIRNILLIRTDEIGDFIVWLDQAKEYRQLFPSYRIVLLHNQVVSEIATRLPYIDQCIPLDKKKIKNKKYCKDLVKKINLYHYEKIIYPCRTRQFETGDWIVHNTNGDDKIGAAVDTYKYRWLCNYFGNSPQYYLNVINNWYTKIVDIPEQHKNTIHEIEYNRLFLKIAFDYDYPLRHPFIPFETPHLNNIPNLPYFVFCLGASTENRRWEISKFVDLAYSIKNHLIVLVGSTQEIPLGEEFTNHLGKSKTCFNIINLIGQTTIIELISLIKHADVVVGNETSTYHISIATSTPSICILGGGHYKRFAPYPISGKIENKLDYTISSVHQDCFYCNWNCQFTETSPNKCIRDISSTNVIALLKHIYPNP